MKASTCLCDIIYTHQIAACVYYTLEPLHLPACVSFFLLLPVNCSDPTLPTDGSIDPYQNTTEGSEIFFRCNSMFVPSTRMTATCTSNGMWTPHPASFTCTCEYLLYCSGVVLHHCNIVDTHMHYATAILYVYIIITSYTPGLISSFCHW